jgi:hypothetical protein
VLRDQHRPWRRHLYPALIRRSRSLGEEPEEDPGVPGGYVAETPGSPLLLFVLWHEDLRHHLRRSPGRTLGRTRRLSRVNAVAWCGRLDYASQGNDDQDGSDDDGKRREVEGLTGIEGERPTGPVRRSNRQGAAP